MDGRTQLSGFHDLMSFRVREILLVSCPYDAFVLEEDGRLSEKIFSEYLDLNLQFAPRIQRASSAEEAFTILGKRTYDLVITMARISDMDPLEFGRRVKEKYHWMHVVMLTFETINNEMIKQIRESKAIDKVFYWSGNSKILLAIIKYVEDLGNAEADTRQGVQAILVVEDSPWSYSQFLPIIYTEIMKQTRYLISYGVNNLHRLLRMRARPKILLAETYEEAMDIFTRYRNNILGVISDSAFPRQGIIDPEAGFHLVRRLKGEIHYLPFLLQSEEQENQTKAGESGIDFLLKSSPNLHLELSNFILENFGFGDFIFKDPSGVVLARASSISEFEEILRTLPEESLQYHADRYHFSRWFRARTEFELAEAIRQVKSSDFQSTEERRRYILGCIEENFKRTQEGIIADFGLSRIDVDNSFIKIGSGSLGGKGRGIAFFNSILSQNDMFKKYEPLKVKTPCSFVICSEVFEEFLEGNKLQEMAVNTDDDGFIAERFLSAGLPLRIIDELRVLVQKIDYPLAVRSSSILEDSQTLPFAGIYSTYILPNNHEDPEIRLKQLLDAVRLVYASVFYRSPKKYVQNANLRIEEERMAVLIQQLVGEKHGDVFYPVISGVAQSYNFYPISYMKAEQGIVSIAMGFGRAVVEGEQVYRFSPAYPKMKPPFMSLNDFMKNSQNQFYALDLSEQSVRIKPDQNCTYRRCDLEKAEKDGTIAFTGSTFSRENGVIRDTLSIPGPRVVTFAPVLSYDLFPLADMIKDLFALGRSSFSSDVEIEFAVNIPTDRSRNIEFYFLQIRPIVVGRELVEVKIQTYPQEELACKSIHTIGNGVFEDIRDIIFVDPDCFDLSQTNVIAQEIGELNEILFQQKRKCILLGFGRMGTSDPWLGIPLVWSQMSQAKVVIEADIEGLHSEPSLGSHFYHNLISLKMGYLHVGKPCETEFIDWDWLKKLPALERKKFTSLVHLDAPVTVRIDGHVSSGVILKPS